MTQNHQATDAAQNQRRTPVLHSDAVQEAKRLEKLQTVSSSHRTSGSLDRPPGSKASAS